jgi:hypothetical protein
MLESRGPNLSTSASSVAKLHRVALCTAYMPSLTVFPHSSQ